tara:strand:+ start:162 stop:380 length:219 start_codon:yes stop_codon:yes gene_type:complete
MPDFSVSTYCFIIGVVLFFFSGIFYKDPGKKDKRFKSGVKNNQDPQESKGFKVGMIINFTALILIGIGWYLY